MYGRDDGRPQLDDATHQPPATTIAAPARQQVQRSAGRSVVGAATR